MSNIIPAEIAQEVEDIQKDMSSIADMVRRLDSPDEDLGPIIPAEIAQELRMVSGKVQNLIGIVDRMDPS
jgi:hypothetical protein